VHVHTPERPTWTCKSCGDEWPCRQSRRQLLADYAEARIALYLYLASHFIAASADLGDDLAGTLHYRFLGWVRVDAEREAYAAAAVLRQEDGRR
jgi:hypothetical protein